MNVLEKVGGTRLLNELIQILNEPEPGGAIARLAMLGLLPSIHPHLRLAPETELIIRESTQLLTWFRLLYLDDACEQWQVYFLALTDRLKPDEFEESCRRLAIPGRIVSHVFAHRSQALGILDALQRRLKHGQEIRNSEIYRWFHGMPLEILLYLAARARHEQVRRFT